MYFRKKNKYIHNKPKKCQYVDVRSKPKWFSELYLPLTELIDEYNRAIKPANKWTK